MTGMLRARVGGQWVDIAGNNDRWFGAWGLVGYAVSQTNQVGFGNTGTVVNQMQLTWTPVVGRRYRTTFSCMVLLHPAPGSGTIPIIQITDTTGTAKQQRNTDGRDGTTYQHLYCEVIETFGSTTPVTRQGRLSTTTGTLDTVVDPNLYPNFISVEDIGPVTGSSVVSPLAQSERWFSAWGIVAPGYLNFADNTTWSMNQVLTNTISFVGVSGRRYRVRFLVRAVGTVANGSLSILCRRDGASGMTDAWAQYLGNTGFSTYEYEWQFVGDGAAHTYDMQVVSLNQSTTGYSGGGLFYIEDVGPVTGAVIIPQVAVTAWAALPLAGSWVAYDTAGTSWDTGKYRSVGDEVMLCGLVANPATVSGSVNVGTLPAGFRPSRNRMFNCAGAGSIAGSPSSYRVDVQTNGLVVLQMGGLAAMAIWFLSLDQIQFSTT